MTTDSTDGNLQTAASIQTLHRYPRYLLYTLCLYSPPIHLADVADQLTLWETGDPPDQHEDERLELYMALYHDHLPDLGATGAVIYDQDADAVDWGPREECLKPVVRRSLRDEMDGLLQAEATTFDECDTVQER